MPRQLFLIRIPLLTLYSHIKMSYYKFTSFQRDKGNSALYMVLLKVFFGLSYCVQSKTRYLCLTKFIHRVSTKFLFDTLDQKWGDCYKSTVDLGQRKVIQHYRSLSKSSRPQNNVTYDKLVHYKDPFMKVEFQIMKDIAAMLTFFWSFRQIPFLSDLLEKLFRRFLELFVKPSNIND